MPMSTFIINNIFFSSCSHTPPSDYGVVDITENIGQYILIYGLGTFADARERAGHRGCSDAWKAFECRNLLKPQPENRQKQ